MTAQTTCARCGAALAPGVRFCSKCGLDVSGEQPAGATARISAVPAPEDPQAGLLEDLRKATLGEFEIAGELGRGGMATVYLAHEIALDRKVAIKVMSPALMQSGPGMADRFKREARTAAALSHPHIIPIFGVRESGRLLFFIMKYVQGRGLDAIIKEHGPLPIKMVQAILSQAGSALDYAHRHGVVHRDIKPANIMLDVEGWAVVTDFGIAKVSDSQGLTMTGATIGTPTYMSPEQCAAKPITGATDQYSLGVAAFEMLTGHVPFDADSVMSLMWQHFHEPPPPILERRPDCPPAIALAVERMLAKAKDDRWPTLEEAIEAIGTPPINDPVRQQMKALARGAPLSEAAMRATPISPVPRGAVPTAPERPPELPSTPVMPIPPVPPPAVTGAATTPIPAVPISGRPTLPDELADSPTALVATPPPPSAPAAKTKKPPPPRFSPPSPPPPTRRRPSGTAPAVTRPGSAAPVPPPFTSGRRGGPALLRWLVIAAALGGLGYGGWMLLGRPPAPTPTPTPRAPTGPAPVVMIAVTPSPAGIVIGKTAQLRAVLKDDHGNVLNGRAVTWSSADSTMVKVSASGVVTGMAPGIVTVTASSEGINGTGTVNVTATALPVASLEILPDDASVGQGDTLAFTAAPKDAQGNTLSGRKVVWRSSNPRVATVSAEGAVSALSLGTATITATVEGQGATARLRVIPPPVAFVNIVPPTVALQVGNRTGLRVEATDAHNRPVTGRPATWSSSAAGIATVSPQGVVVAVGPGRATVTVRVESQSASALITVNAIPVARVTVAPPSLTLAVGKTAPLTVTLQDARGNALRDRDVQWSSSDGTVASVSSNGTVSALAAGKATITATSEGIAANAAIVVPAPPAPPVATNPPVTQPSPQPAPVESLPAAVTPPAPPAATAARTTPQRGVSAGGSHSCGLTLSGTVVCWGSNANGQMGDGGVSAGSSTPAPVAASAQFSAVATGADFSCGLTQGGAALCWGGNAKGQLGSGRANGPPAPVAVFGNHTFQQLTAGERHACGVAADGSAWCWGDNNNGQLGDGSTRGSTRPVQVRGGTRFKKLAAASDHTCGLATDGRVFCWGDGFSGQLGRGTRETQSEPVAIDANGPFIDVAAGGKHACALAQTGKVYCWGANDAGQVGDGSTSERDRPVLVSGTRVYAQITAGTEHSCALTEGGAAYCWGRNREGQLGDGTRTNRSEPARVSSDQAFGSLSAGTSHTCGALRDGGVSCWGGNGKGQLGSGDLTPHPAPTVVQGRP